MSFDINYRNAAGPTWRKVSICFHQDFSSPMKKKALIAHRWISLI